jgi:hypothetical protein
LTCPRNSSIASSQSRRNSFSGTYWPQCFHGNLKFPGYLDQLGIQLLVFGIIAVIESDFALLVAVIQESPLGNRKSRCPPQNLEDEIAVLGTKSVPAQGRQGKRMCGVVSEDETAVGGKCGILRIRQLPPG